MLEQFLFSLSSLGLWQAITSAGQEQHMLQHMFNWSSFIQITPLLGYFAPGCTTLHHTSIRKGSRAACTAVCQGMQFTGKQVSFLAVLSNPHWKADLQCQA